jgi:cell wall-associated NlpC family hydrolase
MNKQESALKYAWRFVTTFYKWGGDDPSGFDCSGLCVEVLKSVGLLPRKYDTTAHGLFNKFKSKEVQSLSAGCLVFWGWPKITHVELCINTWQTIGASGGGSKTLTEADAIRHNAYVKVRPIREGYSKIVNPFI